MQREIRNMDKKKKQIIELWQTCFGDTPEFIDLFFGQVYQDENALVIEKEGKIVSALQMIPYTMNFYGKEIPIAYIAGVSTAPAERGKGLMGRLLQKTFEEMRKRGWVLAVLIPAEKWLFDYYKKNGFTTVFSYSLKQYETTPSGINDSGLTLLSSTALPVDKLFTFFDKKLKERPLGVLHSYQDFLTIINDLRISQGDLWTATDWQGEIQGMAFASGAENPASVYLPEILYTSEQVKQFLLQETGFHYQVPKVMYKAPATSEAAIPYGMAQMILKEELIQTWLSLHPHASHAKEQILDMNEEQLLHVLFRTHEHTAYMSLMLD